MYKIASVLIIIMFAAVSGSFAGAQHDVDSEAWNPPSVGPITTWTAPTAEQGQLIVQPYFYYLRSRGVFNEQSHYKSYTDKDSKWQWQEQLFLTYGITDKWEIEALGVYQQNIKKISGASAESTGFGDTYLYSTYCVMMEEGWLPCTSAWIQLKMPTGKYQKPEQGRLGTDLMGATTGGGSYDMGYGFILTKHIKPFIFHADAIWNIPNVTTVNGVKTQYALYAKYDLGIEYFFYKGFNLMFEANATIQGDRKDDGYRVPSSEVNSLIICPGVGWSCKEVQTLLAYQRTIAGTNVDVNDSIIFTFAYVF